MKSKINLAGFLLGCLSFSFFGLLSCGDESIVGSELLASEDLVLGFTDTLEIQAKTIQVDSVLSYENSVYVPSILLAGAYSDPIFGKYSASFYSQLRFNSDPPEYHLRTVIDSTVLILYLNEEIKFGDSTSNFSFEVYRLTESLSGLSEIYSNKTLAIEETLLGSKEDFRINFDSISIFDPALDSFVLEGPSIRIRLDELLATEILNNLQYSDSEEVFLDIIPGIFVRPTNENNSMIAVEVTSQELRSKMRVYYTDNDTTKLSYDYPLTGIRFNHFDHNYQGSVVENFVDDSELGDSLLFLQSLSGVDIEFNLEDITGMQNVFINYAEIEMTLAELPGDNLELYAPVNNLLASRINTDGEMVEIDDFEIAVTNGSIINIFGGDLHEETIDLVTVKKYRFNITNHVKSVINDNLDTRLIVSGFNTITNPNRSVIFGPKHTSYPVKLNITYTIP